MNWHDFMAETEKNIGKMAKACPETDKGFGIMGKAAKADGHLDGKTKELIALGIAIATKCDSCIGFHTRALIRLGTPREEFCEALAMATYMGGGPAYAYSAKALRAFDDFSGER